MLTRRTALASGALAALVTPLPALAQGRKDSVTLALVLEPPGLDPTAGAASSIAEVTLYNLYETLTKIRPDGSVAPLLAESWEVSPDLKTYTFRLRRDARFHNGAPFGDRGGDSGRHFLGSGGLGRPAGGRPTGKRRQTDGGHRAVVGGTLPVDGAVCASGRLRWRCRGSGSVLCFWRLS